MIQFLTALHSDEMDSQFHEQQSSMISPIGVAEKIRRFLDQVDKGAQHGKNSSNSFKSPRRINAIENLTPSPPTRNKIQKSPRIGRLPISNAGKPHELHYQHPIIAFESLPSDLKFGRHSKCFVPTENKPKKTVQQTTSQKKSGSNTPTSSKNLVNSNVSRNVPNKSATKASSINKNQTVELRNSRTIVRKKHTSGNGSVASFVSCLIKFHEISLN